MNPSPPGTAQIREVVSSLRVSSFQLLFGHVVSHEERASRLNCAVPEALGFPLYRIPSAEALGYLMPSPFGD